MKPGLTTKVDYVRTVDGDTIEVEIRRSFHVRLKDIDVYERYTDMGKEATAYVHSILSDAGEILLFIPSNDPEKLMDINSFSRLVGEIYVDGKNLNDLLEEKGFEK
jgi:endonuclease YncB( thermonuclease family)